MTITTVIDPGTDLSEALVRVVSAGLRRPLYRRLWALRSVEEAVDLVRGGPSMSCR